MHSSVLGRLLDAGGGAGEREAVAGRRFLDTRTGAVPAALASDGRIRTQPPASPRTRLQRRGRRHRAQQPAPPDTGRRSGD